MQKLKGAYSQDPCSVGQLMSHIGKTSSSIRHTGNRISLMSQVQTPEIQSLQALQGIRRIVSRQSMPQRNRCSYFLRWLNWPLKRPTSLSLPMCLNVEYKSPRLNSLSRCLLKINSWGLYPLLILRLAYSRTIQSLHTLSSLWTTQLACHQLLISQGVQKNTKVSLSLGNTMKRQSKPLSPTILSPRVPSPDRNLIAPQITLTWFSEKKCSELSYKYQRNPYCKRRTHSEETMWWLRAQMPRNFLSVEKASRLKCLRLYLIRLMLSKWMGILSAPTASDPLKRPAPRASYTLKTMRQKSAHQGAAQASTRHDFLSASLSKT